MSGGLKGDSTSSPIHLINNLIEDEKKQLWIMFQDIAKAFDSISIKGLELALQRIAVPPPIVRLIDNLFQGRSDSLSPILWRIYYDPLHAITKRQ